MSERDFTIFYKITAILFLMIIFFIGGATIITESNKLTKDIMSVYKSKLPKNPDLENKIKAMLSAFEVEFNNIIYFRSDFINSFGTIQKDIGKHIVTDVDPLKTVYVDKQGILHWINPKVDTGKFVKKVVDFNKILKEKEIPMLFVMAPYKNLKGFTQLPVSVVDYTNQNADEFLSGLKTNKLDSLDLRTELEKESFDKASLFYRTDHHWKSKTAFWGYQTTLPYINKMLGRPTNPKNIDPANFAETKLPQSYLGSQGIRVGSSFGGVDDYELMLPNFTTNYESKYFFSSNKTESFKGTFEDTIIKKKYLDPKSSFYTNRYSAYFGGIFPRIDITNKAGKGKLLIIQDSFGNGVYSPFMALNFNKTTIIDLRLYNKKPISKLVIDEHYDMVLMLYNPSCLSINATQKFNLR